MKLAFVTTIKDRLPHLMQTWEENRQVLQQWHTAVSWTLLDYGSQTDVRNWYVDRVEGRGMFPANYFRYESELYHSSHAKNVASLLVANNFDVVCNLDCDNYLSMRLMRQLFNLQEGHLSQGRKDAAGRVAIRFGDFLRIRGYDEELHSWGFDDVEMVRRAGLNGIKRVDDSLYDKYIRHSDELRGQNMLDKDTTSSFGRNKAYMERVIGEGRLVANPHGWGVATVSDLAGRKYQVGNR